MYAQTTPSRVRGRPFDDRVFTPRVFLLTGYPRRLTKGYSLDGIGAPLLPSGRLTSLCLDLRRSPRVLPIPAFVSTLPCVTCIRYRTGVGFGVSLSTKGDLFSLAAP